MIQQSQKITAAERIRAISKYPQLQQAIESGAWEYSPSKLKADLEAYTLTTWVQVHPFLTMIIFIAAFLLGMIGAVIFMAVLFFSKSGRERYELAILKLKNGTLQSKIRP